MISCKDESPARASQIANSLAKHFLQQQGNPGYSSNSTLQDIDKKIEILGNELAVTENQIANYKKENKITELDFDTEKSLSILKELQLQKTQLKMNKT